MKNLIIIVIAIILFALLLNVASKKFDNVKGEVATEQTVESPSEEPSEDASEDTSEDEGGDTSEESSSESTPPSPPVKIDMSAEFTVIDMDGNDVKRSDLAGKPIVVLFWASWYTYSREELVAIQTVYEAYKDNYEFMAICITDGEYETLESAKAYLDSTDFSVPIYFDVYCEVLHNYLLYEFESVARTYFFKADAKYTARISAGAILTADLLQRAISIVYE
ncbi:MAG: TlpA family protein disulfide reductase [Clostridia bacterium]|nr:TlpA family protein disulfide reductase [Clostridia bacterium]